MATTTANPWKHFTVMILSSNSFCTLSIDTKGHPGAFQPSTRTPQVRPAQPDEHTGKSCRAVQGTAVPGKSLESALQAFEKCFCPFWDIFASLPLVPIVAQSCERCRALPWHCCFSVPATGGVKNGAKGQVQIQ